MLITGRRTALASCLLAVVLTTACAAGRLHLPGYVHPVEESSASFESLGRTIRVDVYVPEGRNQRHPAAIVLHGSSGIHLVGGESVERYAEALANRGIATYVVYYFDATGTFTASVATEARQYWRWVRVVHDAVDWVRARPEVRPGHVGLFGVSMGAYLAVGVAGTSPLVSRMVLLSGGLEPGVADSARHLPPTLLLHGVDDTEVTTAQSDSLAHWLAQRRTIVVSHRYPGEGHDFSERAAIDVVDRSARFLAEGRVGTLLEVLRRSNTRGLSSDTGRTHIP